MSFNPPNQDVSNVTVKTSTTSTTVVITDPLDVYGYGSVDLFAEVTAVNGANKLTTSAQTANAPVASVVSADYSIVRLGTDAAGVVTNSIATWESSIATEVSGGVPFKVFLGRFPCVQRTMIFGIQISGTGANSITFSVTANRRP